MLERLDGSAGRGAEIARRILFGGEAELSQSVAEIVDGVTARALREREDVVCPYRYAEIPTRRALGSPSLNRSSVGTLITS